MRLHSVSGESAVLHMRNEEESQKSWRIHCIPIASKWMTLRRSPKRERERWRVACRGGEERDAPALSLKFWIESELPSPGLFRQISMASFCEFRILWFGILEQTFYCNIYSATSGSPSAWSECQNKALVKISLQARQRRACVWNGGETKCPIGAPLRSQIACIAEPHNARRRMRHVHAYFIARAHTPESGFLRSWLRRTPFVKYQNKMLSQRHQRRSEAERRRKERKTKKHIVNKSDWNNIILPHSIDKRNAKRTERETWICDGRAASGRRYKKRM